MVAAQLLKQKSKSLRVRDVKSLPETLKVRISDSKTNFSKEESMIEILNEALSFKDEK